MCGICGAMSPYLSSTEIDGFRDLMVISTLRGYNGSGVAVIHEGKKQIHPHVLRNPATGAFLVSTKGFDDLVSRRPKILLGHTRAPTKGAVELKNVHPHVARHITGVHNGTLYEVDGKHVPFDESDSAKIFEQIAEVGVERAIKKVKGGYVLVWIDEKERTLNFLRNSQRTLFYAEHPSVNTIYWASEDRFLSLMLDRRFKAGDGWKIHAVPEDKLISYPLKVADKMRPNRVTVMKPEEVIYAGWQGHGARGSNWHRTDDKKTGPWAGEYDYGDTVADMYTKDEIVKPTAAETAAIVKSGQSVIPFRPRDFPAYGSDNREVTTITSDSHDTGPADVAANSDGRDEKMIRVYIDGNIRSYVRMHKSTLSQMLMKGCTHCGNPGSAPDDFHEVKWISCHQFVCLDCLTTPAIGAPNIG